MKQMIEKLEQGLINDKDGTAERVNAFSSAILQPKKEESLPEAGSHASIVTQVEVPE